MTISLESSIHLVTLFNDGILSTIFFLLFIPLSTNSNFVWLGLQETGTFAVDYFPLNPWLGIFFIFFIGIISFKILE